MKAPVSHRRTVGGQVQALVIWTRIPATNLPKRLTTASTVLFRSEARGALEKASAQNADCFQITIPHGIGQFRELAQHTHDSVAVDKADYLGFALIRSRDFISRVHCVALFDGQKCKRNAIRSRCLLYILKPLPCTKMLAGLTKGTLVFSPKTLSERIAALASMDSRLAACILWFQNLHESAPASA